MVRTFAAVLLATSMFAGAASAHGGGPAETMPGTNFSDMPSWHPAKSPRRFEYMHHPVRTHQGSARDD